MQALVAALWRGLKDIDAELLDVSPGEFVDRDVSKPVNHVMIYERQVASESRLCRRKSLPGDIVRERVSNGVGALLREISEVGGSSDWRWFREFAG